MRAAQQVVVKQMGENIDQEAIRIAEKKCEEFEAFVSDVNDDVTQINKLVEELYLKFTFLLEALGTAFFLTTTSPDFSVLDLTLFFLGALADSGFCGDLLSLGFFV